LLRQPSASQLIIDDEGWLAYELAKLERGEQEPTWREVQALCHPLGDSCETFAKTKKPPLK
jgi:hypothetical protein